MTKAKNLFFSLLALSILVFSFTSCTDKVEKENVPEVLAPEQIVKIVEAENMYDNYSKRRVPLIQRYEDSIYRSGGKDKMLQEQQTQQKKTIDKKVREVAGAEGSFDVARYVFYDYKTIKQYLAYVEQEAKKAGVEISGLRLYFSNYSEDPKNVHPKQNSVLLSPTINRDNRDRIFYIDATEGKQQAVLLTDSFGDVKVGTLNGNNKSYASILPDLSSPNSNTILTTSFYATKSLTMNKGGSAPPPYSED